MRGGPELITMEVPEAAYASMTEAAQAAGLKPRAYAQKLFDSAMKVSLGRQRGMPTTDAELDEQVRLVLACSGTADAAAIARATGIAESLVEKFLHGLRQTGVALAVEATSHVPPVPEFQPLKLLPPTRAGARTPETIATIRTMWAAGKTAAEIAEATGSTAAAIHKFANENRDVCPKRRGADR